MSKMLGIVAGLSLLLLAVSLSYGAPPPKPVVTLSVRSRYGSPDPPTGRWDYPNGTVITASVGSPVSGDPGTRYVCAGWKARGSSETLPPTGTTNFVTFIITTNTSITWLWKTEYYFTGTSNPPEGGYVTPPSGWYNQRETLTVEAHPNPGWEFSFWAGALRGSTNPQRLTMRGPRTVIANFSPLPQKRYLTVISAYGEPVPPVGTHEYDEGVTINANCGPNPYPLSASGTRYLCTGHLGTGNVTDGPQTSISFVITVDSSVTWLWQTQHELTTAVSPPGGGTITRSPNAIWYDSDTVVQLTAVANTGYAFANWSGDLTGTENPQSLSMNSPKSVTANFVLEKRYFTVNSAYGAPVPAVGIHEYDYGSAVNANCGPTPYSGGAGIQYVCTGHSGTGNVTGGSQTSISFTITMNSSVTWLWQTQYQLTTAVNPGGGGSVTPASGSWHNAGAVISCTATANTGYIFANWSGDLSGTTNPQDLTMNGPKSITANFTLLRSFTVVSAQGAPVPPVGTYYYSEGSTVDANCGTTPYPPSATGTRYVCTGHSGTGNVTGGSQTSISFTITMNSSVTWLWQTQYQLTTAVNPGGSGSVTPASGSWHNAGAVVSCLATPNAGWGFSNWSGDLSGTDNPKDLTMNSAKSITANFFKPTLTVISAQGAPVPAVGTHTYDYNSTVNANCGPTPYSGGAGTQYICTGHSGTGNVTGGSQTSISFTITMNSSVTWLWQTQYQLTTAVNPGGSGSVTPASGSWHNAGAVVSCLATPNAGWGFSNWSGDLTGTDNPKNLTMNSAKSITANFFKPTLTVISAQGAPVPAVGTHEYDYGSTVNANCGTTPYSGGAGVQYVCTGHSGTGNVTGGSQTSISFTITMNSSVTWLWQTQYQLTTAVNPGGSGSVTPASGSWHNAGAVVSCLATPNTGYVFANWSGDLSGTTNPQNLTMNGPKSITANFTTETPDKRYFTVISAQGAPVPAVGTHEYDNGATVNANCGTTPYSGGAGIQYVCTGHSGTGNVTGGSQTSISFTITMNSSVTWLWQTQHQLTTAVNPGGSGSVTPASGSWHNAGAVVSCLATPNSGWGFSNWSGDLTGTDNPKDLTMNSAKSITANFFKPTLTVISAQGAPVPAVGTHTYDYNSTVNANCGPTPYSGGAGTQYICTGHTGTGNVTGGSQTSISFTITMNSSVTWLWQTQYQLTTAVNPGGGGSVTPASGSWHNAGAVISCTATANTGYVFANWSGDLSGTTNPQDLTMNGPKSITANFTPLRSFTVISAQGAPVPAVGTYQYPEGTNVDANCGPTPYSGGAGIQYVCTGHSGTGNVTGGSQTSISFTITMNSSVTWLWQTQYQLTTAVNPGGSGSVTPASGSWHNSGAVVSCLATPNAGWGFSNWSGDLSGTDNPKNLTMNSAKSITANFFKPTLTVISAQGAPVPAVGTHTYDYNSTVNANCGPTPYSGGAGTQYICTGHTGTGNVTGGSQTSISFTITMNSSVTWLWQTQYYLTVTSAYGNPQGEGWYNAGATANWSVTSPWPGAAGTRYVATPPTSGSVVMNSPQTVTVTWTTQYYLTVTSAYGNPQGEGWYNAGATANWSVTSPWPGAAGTRYVATPPTSGSVVMNSPQTVTVTWTTQYYLTVVSAYGAPTGEGWYNEGATANWSVTSPWPGAAGIRYVATPPTSGSVVMNSPQTVTVTWTTQYYLTILSAYGDPDGAGYYDAGTTANWSVTSPYPGDPGIRYVADPASGSVLMDEPKTVTVSWTTQYELTTDVTPPEGGTITRSPNATWYNSGTVVQLTAVANVGWVFTNWSGDLGGSTNPQSLTMDGPKSAQAHFAAAVPNADFTGAPTSGPVPLTVLFTDASTGNITSWAWDFGSGASPATANTQGPHSVTYNTTGLKTVSLTVTGPGGSDTETKVNYITVTSGVPAPVAGFSGSPRSSTSWPGTASYEPADFPLNVTFTDESTGNITSWAWDFNNDTVVDSTAQNPSWTYSTTGKFTVRLTVTGPGGSGSETKTDYIRIIPTSNRIYVRTGGLDTSDGLSWSTAKKTIQAGINAAGNDWAVLVARATYSIAGNYNLDFGGKTIHLKGVSSTTGAHNSGTIWRIDGGNVSGRRGFIFQTGETAHTVVDNFQIYRGNAGTEEGGGVYAYGASPTIMNCLIWVCRGVDGGGIYCDSGANLTITGCTLTSNQATDGDGGGIYIIGSNPRISGCTIGAAGAANTSTNNGGGLYLYNSNAWVSNCTFDSNSTTWWGGAIYGGGSSTPRISNCQILNNVAGDQGGGIYLVTNCDALIGGCTIAGNTTSWFGAGVYVETSTPTITGCTIGGDTGGNIAGSGGGGIYIYSCSPLVRNCAITYNSAVAFAGGIECDYLASPQITNCLIAANETTADPGTGDGNGAGVDVYGNSNPIFTNCTIAGNNASRNGGGIYSSVSNPVLRNTILWGNTAAVSGNQIYTWSATSYVTLNYSDYTNGAGDVSGPGTVTATNCITSDPLFVDAGSYDYHLQASSPCRDAGSNALVPAGITTDLDGNPRFVGSAVDMGAYEYQP